MLKNVINIVRQAKTCSALSRYYSTAQKVDQTGKDVVHHQTQLTGNYKIIDTRGLPSDDYIDEKFEKRSALDECREDISHVAPYLKPTFNFAAYINNSETLQSLLRLGVNLHSLEKQKGVPEFILKLDFENHIKNYIIFLHDRGLDTEEIAVLLTKNPFILKENLDDLDVRINYLKSKKFDDQMILRILTKNPHWLSFSTQEIDNKLGFFQKTFKLNGNEVRELTVLQPKLITYKLSHVKMNLFVIKEEMGFTEEQLKMMLLKRPNLFLKSQKLILPSFEYMHMQMNIPLETIAETPKVLTCRKHRLKQRHLFLEKLGKLQFDPTKPNYISIIDIVSHTDEYFATEIAKSSIHTFNAFLKTL